MVTNYLLHSTETWNLNLKQDDMTYAFVSASYKKHNCFIQKQEIFRYDF